MYMLLQPQCLVQHPVCVSFFVCLCEWMDARASLCVRRSLCAGVCRSVCISVGGWAAACVCMSFCVCLCEYFCVWPRKCVVLSI